MNQLVNLKEKRNKVTVNVRRYFPRSISKHVNNRFGENSSQKLFKVQNAFKYDFKNIQVFDNEEPASVRGTKERPKSYLFILANGDHVIINIKGNIVSYIPAKLLDDKNEKFLRCDCTFCNKK